jgi:putative inorganic carbon (hco3(-)) transporter
MRDILVTLIVFGCLPFALFEPFIGVALWTWLSVMNPHRLTWGFAYNYPFAQATAIVTLAGLLFAHKKIKFPFNGTTVTLIAFSVWMTVTYATAIHFGASYEMWSRVSKTLLMTLVALAAVRTEKQIQIFFWILVMSVTFFGIKGGVFAILTGGEYKVYGPPESHIEDNNAISVALVMMIPLLAYLYQHAPRRWIKPAMLTAILLSIASILASYSRGAFVAVSAMLLFLAIKSRQRILMLAFLAIAVPVMIAAMPSAWWERMSTITSDNPDSSVMGRFNAWSMAWNLAVDRPVFGGGFAIYEPDVFGRYAPDPLDIHAAHSIYFQMLGEHGFVGLGLFLLLAFLMWRTGTRIIRGSGFGAYQWRADLARALQVSVVGFLVGGITVNIGYWDVYYFELVLLVALEQLMIATKRSQSESQEAIRTTSAVGFADNATRTQ